MLAWRVAHLIRTTPQAAKKHQRKPKCQIPWIQPWWLEPQVCTVTHFLPPMSPSPMAWATPVPSRLSSAPTGTLCMCDVSATGPTVRRPDCQWARVCQRVPAAYSYSPLSCLTAHCHDTQPAPPERSLARTSAGSDSLCLSVCLSSCTVWTKGLLSEFFFVACLFVKN